MMYQVWLIAMDQMLNGRHGNWNCNVSYILHFIIWKVDALAPISWIPFLCEWCPAWARMWWSTPATQNEILWWSTSYTWITLICEESCVRLVGWGHCSEAGIKYFWLVCISYSWVCARIPSTVTTDIITRQKLHEKFFILSNISVLNMPHVCCYWNENLATFRQ